MLFKKIYKNQKKQSKNNHHPQKRFKIEKIVIINKEMRKKRRDSL